MAACRTLGCLLDTSAVILHLRNFPGMKELLLELLDARGQLAVSTVTLVEVWQGVKAGEEGKTRRFFEGVSVIPLDAELAEKAGELARSLRENGFTIELADIIIAAAALAAKVPVLTTNRRHFSFVDGLEVLEIKSLLGCR
ncbi:PIN domain-containing protein [Desulfofundulus salinus]|uniref:Ribonuclease VapC n=1 Tax=Desulfofundulus salinus TaxID=2419843 RepID=A0A494WR54_9FIRM|nr:PIN domain-containing protein [Desulfofundulus salinum]RKO65659.1 type II toxin-antitoxin system VapC family toxin [Desulfofundulus salinum]